jgi:predicted methyltransferase MtxX (methanogen marker protein 4)
MLEEAGLMVRGSRQEPESVATVSEAGDKSDVGMGEWLKAEFKEVFAAPTGLPPNRPRFDHHIHITSNKAPHYRNPIRLSPEERA